MFQARKAERKASKLRLGLSGPAGSGKTYSSLLLAYGLVGSWEKIALVDTENGSADLYSHLGPYTVIPFAAPYSPKRFCEAIAYAEGLPGVEVVIIDSATHEWNGIGGCLEIHEKLGGRFDHWKNVTPMHRKFLDTILQARTHMIITLRTKEDYVLEKNERGKNEPRKVGMKKEMRDGFEYEVTVNLDLAGAMATASKDRTSLFADRLPFVITAETGQMFRKWCESGMVPSAQPQQAAATPAPSPPVASSESVVLPLHDQIKQTWRQVKQLCGSDQDAKAFIQLVVPKPSVEWTLLDVELVEQAIESAQRARLNQVVTNLL